MTNIKYVYFLGIGGIGMSAIARYFLNAGKQVFGYDKTATPLTNELIQEGAHIHFDENLNAIPDFIKNNIAETLVVLTPAIPAAHAELKYFQEHNFTIYKRAKVLGVICANHKTLAVAGTHGKTTTSTLLAHILKSAQGSTNAFLGGISINYHTNFLLSENEAHNSVVVEADEFDRSFLTLFPEFAIITSTDPDHLDIYGNHSYMLDSYNMFASQVKQGGNLVYKKGIDLVLPKGINCFSYSLKDTSANYHAKDLRIENGYYFFTLVTPTLTIDNIKFGIPGSHNVENAVAAAALSLLYGLSPEKVKSALESFTGVKRRFEYHIRKDNFVYIDDYAHHPAELSACIKSVKEIYPDKKITGIFQPHLFSRTRDFAEGFAESLSLLDEVILMEIYPARELPIEGISSTMLLNKITSKDKILVAKADLVQHLQNKNTEVLLTLGAGDIDAFVEPITNALKNK